jgi:predicted RNA-binding Zn-ribbon protein involved in translation (DUF1610 family)
MGRGFAYILIILISIGFSSCDSSEKSFSQDEFSIEGQTEDGFEDGTYCANVTYHNPNTGTTSEYTLDVEVSNNQVIRINWSNGGWMDEDHFSPETLSDTGYCLFESDKGYEYTVQITGSACGSSDASAIRNDIEEDELKLKCPKCGNEKHKFDDYCDDCQNEIDDEEDNTCSNCGEYEIGCYGGLCSDCEAEEYGW